MKEDDTVHDLQLRLQAETKIAVAEQELLLNTGLSPDPSKPAKMYAADLVITCQFYLKLREVGMPGTMSLPGGMPAWS